MLKQTQILVSKTVQPFTNTSTSLY